MNNCHSSKPSVVKRECMGKFAWLICIGFFLVSCIESDTQSPPSIANEKLAGIDNQIPVFLGEADLTVDVNSRDVTILRASDSDGDALSFRISRGEDQALFALEPLDDVSAQLRFNERPKAGEYTVTALVSDGKVGVEKDLRITVGCGEVPSEPSVLNDFECQENVDFLEQSGERVATQVNPDREGENTSLLAAVVPIANSSAENADVISAEFEQRLDQFIDLDVTSGLSVQVLAPSSVAALAPSLVINVQGAGASLQRKQTLVADGKWHTYQFDFKGVDEGSTQLGIQIQALDKLTENILIDNIRFVPLPCPPANTLLINDFECQTSFPLMAVRDGVSISTVSNPDTSALNQSRISAAVDLSTNDGLRIDFGGPVSGVVDLSKTGGLALLVYLPEHTLETAPSLVASLQGGENPSVVRSNLRTQSQWVELIFDFSNADTNSTELLLNFEGFAEAGAPAQVFIDQLRFVSVECPEADSSIINDFECQQNFALPPYVAVVDNPDRSALNISSKVGEFTDPTEEFAAMIIDFGGPIDLTENNRLRLKVRAPVSGTLLAKLEGGSASPIEITNEITIENSWQEYTFDFGSEANADHSQLVLFFNIGQATDGTDVYYIDDLRFDCALDPAVLNDFECQSNRTVPGVRTVENPDKSEVNPSEQVGEFIDAPEAFAATVLDFGSPIDLSANNQFKIKVRAPVMGPMVVKLEGGTAPPVEIQAQVNKVGQWQDLTFDFSSQATADHSQLVLFFNFGVANGGTDVYQIDDLRWDAKICPAVDPAILSDFDCQQNVAFPVAIVPNPNSSPLNASAQVGQFTDPPDAFGAMIVNFPSAPNLTEANQLKMKLLAPVAGPVVAKLEGGTSPAFETAPVAVSASGEWEELTFDFSSQAASDHTVLVLFFNFAVENSGADIYYIDDVRFTAP